MADKRRPVAQVSVGAVNAAIWQNNHRDKPLYTVSFEVRYKDRCGEWQTTSSFDQAHLLELAKAADLAYDKIAALRSNDSEPSLPG